jgi:hypothetical protein
MIVFHYIYYKIFRFWNLLSFGISRMQYRAAAFFSLIIASNIVSLFKQFDIKLWDNPLITIATVGIWVFLNYCYFLNPKRHRRIVKMFRNEGIALKVLGSFAVVVYTIFSFVIFIKSMSG